MKVLHFYKTSVPESMGGIEQVIHQIGLGAAKQGVQTDVLSLTCGHVPRTVDVGGYLVHRARMDLQIASTGFSISALLRFYQLARQANVIHYHFPWPFMDVVHFATMVNKPTVVTYHSDIIRQKHLLKVYRPLKHCFLRDVDRIVATSPNYLETSEVLGRYRDKVSVIPIGLDRETYPEATPERLKFWRSKVGSRFFLFVGVLRYYKGLHILMEAAKGGQFPIVIVGAGPIELELRTQARNLGLSNVLFFGQLPEIDKVALLELSYAVVFPSHLRSEAFGISLLEGAMFGKPMISSEIGTGTTFINIANETGLVVPPSDPSALRGAMGYLWEHPDKAQEMGTRALQRYWRHFTAERMVADYIDLYREVLDPEQRVLP
ncbi:glycosyltransferase family 4 protein [Pseudomonas otitidis]|uniref:glycosyltransferase family 4 protein n=1 Tax=Metapseudomonas otitidis TaxID=319939 RepID=UPI00244BEFB5|nr:glycosyltransferase family 4 protein [Pseudomonas otitidis]MDH1109256.1 glycosyltransferase family 4 protein [Pseudomonas otitidis]MDH1159976.1 glycosyltransferase family 4 protein [Pseudomonas otitidis]MDH1167416.1 glycosyltransferase family 4 protein [Pseudomonas otitidis]